ncbi:MAG: DUF5817 domain-containing protein [Halobacteriaceae archaeon]
MYAVVGCSECSALWVITTDNESAGCPRCGTRHQQSRLKQFVTTDDEAHAREVRASMLAARQDESDAFAALDDYATMAEQASDGVVGDEEYLSAAGLDPDAIAEAGERATQGAGGSDSRQELVLQAITAIDEPTAEAVVAALEEDGIPAETVHDLLDRLERAGRVTVSDGVYRRL